MWGIWTFQSLVIATQNYLTLHAPGRPAGPRPPPSFAQMMLLELPVWYSWALATPLIGSLTRRFPLTRDAWPRSLAVHLAASVVVGALVIASSAAIRLVLLPHFFDSPYLDIVTRGVRRTFGLFMLVYFAVLGVTQAMQFQRALQARALQAVQLETLLAQSQLEVLRVQLQPHFLFNTLHAVSALMERDAKAARAILARLGDLLRLALASEKTQQAPLAQELELLDHYLEIQRIRMRERLQVDIDVPDETRGLRIPHLLLQTLAENAVRHGIEPKPGGGRIAIRARIEGPHLILTIDDDGGGFPPVDQRIEGVGLTNTRERLARLHGGRARLGLGPSPMGGARVTVELPIDPQDRA